MNLPLPQTHRRLFLVVAALSLALALIALTHYAYHRIFITPYQDGYEQGSKEAEEDALRVYVGGPGFPAQVRDDDGTIYSLADWTARERWPDKSSRAQFAIGYEAGATEGRKRGAEAVSKLRGYRQQREAVEAQKEMLRRVMP